MTLAFLIRGVRLWAGSHAHLHPADRTAITSPGSPVGVREPLGNTKAPGIDLKMAEGAVRVLMNTSQMIRGVFDLRAAPLAVSRRK